MEQKQILHILRNPEGKTFQEINDARLAAADEIERLQREILDGRSLPNSERCDDLQPLPEALFVADELWRKAKELTLIAQRLEAFYGRPESRRKVEFEFDPKKNKKQGKR